MSSSISLRYLENGPRVQTSAKVSFPQCKFWTFLVPGE